MSHEGERATGLRMQDEADRAPPHWLNPLVRRHGHLSGRVTVTVTVLLHCSRVSAPLGGTPQLNLRNPSSPKVNSRDLAAPGSRHRPSVVCQLSENLNSCILYTQFFTPRLY